MPPRHARLQGDALELVKGLLSPSDRPKKILPLSLDGRRSEMPHWFVALLDAQKRTLEWDDSAAGQNEAIDGEREEFVATLADLVRRAGGSEWAGLEARRASWPGGAAAEEQHNTWDCGTHASIYALAMAEGREAPQEIGKTEEVRAFFAEHLAAHGLGITDHPPSS